MNIITDYKYKIYKKACVTHLSILSQRDGNACRACEAADGKTYELDYAYNNQVLPHPECESEECRCSFLPILDNKI